MPGMFVDPPEDYKPWGATEVAGVLTHKTVQDALDKMMTIDLKARAEAEERQLALYRWLVKEGEQVHVNGQHATGRPDEGVRERHSEDAAEAGLHPDQG